MKTGKIIAIVGPPRSGKSFLVRKLAKHYDGKFFLEGEEADFPEQIKEDIAKNIRPLERVLWFRTKLVSDYLQALELKKQGHTVILDTFWMSPQLFIGALLAGFEKELMSQVCKQDEQLLSWPDVTIFLKISEKGIREFIKRGGRTFDASEDFLTTQALPVNKLHEEFFAKSAGERKVITIERDDLDFEKTADVDSLAAKIDVLR